MNKLDINNNYALFFGLVEHYSLQEKKNEKTKNFRFYCFEFVLFFLHNTFIFNFLFLRIKKIKLKDNIRGLERRHCSKNKSIEFTY